MNDTPQPLNEARRRAYLEAMGFDVWVSRFGGPSGGAGRLQLGPGQGSTLVVCSALEESASRLAGDLARVLGGDPVWAWPDRDAAPEAVALDEAIGARLITRVLVLGTETAHWLFAGTTPEVVGSAAVTVAASLQELCTRGAARQALWRRLRGASSASADA